MPLTWSKSIWKLNAQSEEPKGLGPAIWVLLCGSLHFQPPSQGANALATGIMAEYVFESMSYEQLDTPQSSSPLALHEEAHTHAYQRC